MIGQAAESNPQDCENTPLISRRDLLFNRIWIRLLTSVSAIAEGYDLAVFSGAVNRIEDEFKLSSLHVGFLFASTGIGMMMGVCVVVLADYVGRRKILLLAFVTLIASSAWCALTAVYWQLLASRILCGAGCFAGAATTCLYISEVSPQHVRGFYSSMEDFFINVGVMGAFTANLYFLDRSKDDWRYTVAVGAAPAVLALAMAVYFLPESPRFLHLQHKELEGRRTLELFVEKEEVEDVVAGWAQDSTSSQEGILETPERRRALLIGVGVGSLPAFSGIPFLLHLQGWILKHDGYGQQGAALSQWITSIVKTLVLVAAMPLMDVLGRRTLLLVSVAGMGFSNLVIAYVFFMNGSLTTVIVALSVSLSFYSVGIGPVPFAYLPEIFDTGVRAQGLGLSFLFSRVWSGALTMLGPMLLTAVGLPPCMLVCGGLAVGQFLFVYFLCPETKNLKLEDVFLSFKSPKSGEHIA